MRLLKISRVSLSSVVLPIGVGGIIAVSVALLLEKYPPVLLVYAFAGIVVFTPSLIVKNVKLYWLVLFVLAVPLNIRKAGLADPITVANLLDQYGTPAGAMPAPVLRLSDFIFLILLCLWAIRVAQKREPLVITRISWIALAYLAWSALSIFVAPIKYLALLELIERVKVLLVFLYFSSNISSPKEIRYVMICLLVGLALQGALSLYQFSSQGASNPLGALYDTEGLDIERLKSHYLVKGPTGDDVYRVGGTVSPDSPNSQGQYYLLLLPMSLALIFAARRIFLSSLVLFLGLAGLIFTFSRGALTGFLVSALVLVSIGAYRKLIPRMVPLSSAMFLLCLTPWIYIYMATRPEYISLRFDLWKVGLPIVYDHPVLGVGLNNAVAVGKTYDDPLGVFFGTSFHNFYITTSAEIGLVGLGLFIATFVGAGWCAFRSFGVCDGDRMLSSLSIVIPATFAGIAVHFMVDHLTGEINATLLWMFAGLGVALSQLKSASSVFISPQAPLDKAQAVRPQAYSAGISSGV